jgi:VanZ family protein
VKKLRVYLPPVAWMAVIFMFSTIYFGEDTTYSFLDKLAILLRGGISSHILWKIDFVLRKSAHVTEFMLLSYLWAGALARGENYPAGRAAAAALVISVVYAATDEYHQTFVPGRSGNVGDVLIDASGASLGAIIAWAGQKKSAPQGMRL